MKQYDDRYLLYPLVVLMMLGVAFMVIMSGTQVI